MVPDRSSQAGIVHVNHDDGYYDGANYDGANHNNG